MIEAFKFFLILIIQVLCVGGYGLNVVKLVHTDFKKPYKEEVIRGVGVFVPLVGAITGFMTLDDTLNSVDKEPISYLKQGD